MKKLLLSVAIMATSYSTIAQVGIGTTTPDASSVLELKSTDKGFLLPRMSTVQRDAISSPANGLTVFNTSTNLINFYDGAQWVAAPTPAGSVGSSITDADADTKIQVEKTADEDVIRFDADGVEVMRIQKGEVILPVKSGSLHSTYIEMGTGRDTDGYAILDMLGDATYTDYGLRIIRGNTGANTYSGIDHRGTGNFEIKASEPAPLLFSTTGTERMRVSPTGNVGIGTSTPATKLDVRGTTEITSPANYTSSLRLRNVAGNMTYNMTHTGPNDAASFIFFDGLGTAASNEVAHISGNGNTFFNGGNVGIGTTTPSNTLQINGSGTNIFYVDKGTEGNFGEGFSSTFNINQGTGNPGGERALTVHGNGVNTGNPVEFYSHDGTNYLLGFAQDTNGNVGIGTPNPNASAVLDVNSTTKGFLPPRVTTAQRDAIANPAVGLTIFNTNTNSLNLYSSTSGWKELTSSTTGQGSVVNSAGSVFKLPETGYGYGGVYQKNEQIYKYGNTNTTIRFFGMPQGNTDPVLVPMVGRSENSTIQKFAYTESTLFVLDSDGKLYIHGYNHWGIHGDGNTTGTAFNDYLEPVTHANISGAGIVVEDFWITKQATSSANTNIVKTTVIVQVNDNGIYKHYGWGNNEYNVAGVGPSNPSSIDEPTRLDQDAALFGTDKIVKAEIVGFFTLFLTQSGKVYGVGYNNGGNLGIGHNSTVSQITLSNITSGAIDVQGSWMTGISEQSQVLKSDGTVWSTGNNSRYSMGDGTTINRSTYAQNTSLSNIIKLGVRSDVQMALDSAGKLYAWGNNYDYVFANSDGLNQARSTPVVIKTNVSDFWVLASINSDERGLVTVNTSGETRASGKSKYYRFGAPSSSSNAGPTGQPIYFGSKGEYPVKIMHVGVSDPNVGTAYLTNKGNLYYTGRSEGHAVYNKHNTSNVPYPLLME